MPDLITILGLGLMGTAFTDRFMEHGWQVRVWNRTREKGRSLIERGAVWTDEPFAQSKCCLLCLFSSQAVREVIEQTPSVAAFEGCAMIDLLGVIAILWPPNRRIETLS
jgi:3-hydroxyisobutyrate dehydrogenase-like beta-hydroxyacid dehydrogenase